MRPLCSAEIRPSYIHHTLVPRANEWHSRSAVFTCAPDIPIVPMAILHNAHRARTPLICIGWESIVSVLCMHVCECARALSSDSMIFFRFCSFILHFIIVIVHTIPRKNRKRQQNNRHVDARNGTMRNRIVVESRVHASRSHLYTRVSRVRLLHRAHIESSTC